ncbi:MAG: alcohol dehydrogenase catalytic domain-containing protein [Anaerolineaceae bacterium]|nr:alcohol dehydrogenase catalytic domain-containing protein [Anaerolineaceae bacterium]
MKMMKAMVLEEPKKFVYKDVPVPTINTDEVLIKVKFCGICGSDWGSYNGMYEDEVACLPLITGHEFWGVVEKVGENVTSIKAGDRVAVDICLTCGTCYYCRRGEPLLCEEFSQIGIHVDGAFAEYVKAPANNCYIVPDEIDDHSATFIEPLTACINASRKMNCELGASVAVIGAGLGIIHALLAKLRGAAPVIVIDGQQKRLEMAKNMSADMVIDFTKTPDTVAEIMKITNGVGVDYVIEAVGSSKTYEQAFQMIRRGGKLEAFGICSDDDFAKLPPAAFVLQEKKIAGSCAGIGHDWEVAISLLQYKRVDPCPLISMIVPLSELEEALNELHDNKDLVKVLVCPEITERILLI